MNTNKDSILFKRATVSKPIYNITPFTLLDYPDKTACILWFAGCNMRCVYCYNPEIVKGKGNFLLSEALKFIESRKGLLDGVVFSGGECTLHQDILWLADRIKSMGMSVKIDTNGSRPRVLETLIREKLVDFISLDFKSLKSSFETITGSRLYHEFEESLELLLRNKINFEVRTTIHSELIPEEAIQTMVCYLNKKGYKGTYFLQHFVDESPTLEELPPSDRRKVQKKYSQFDLEVVWRN